MQAQSETPPEGFNYGQAKKATAYDSLRSQVEAEVEQLRDEAAFIAPTSLKEGSRIGRHADRLQAILDSTSAEGAGDRG